MRRSPNTSAVLPGAARMLRSTISATVMSSHKPSRRYLRAASSGQGTQPSSMGIPPVSEAEFGMQPLVRGGQLGIALADVRMVDAAAAPDVVVGEADRVQR